MVHVEKDRKRIQEVEVVVEMVNGKDQKVVYDIEIPTNGEKAKDIDVKDVVYEEKNVKKTTILEDDHLDSLEKTDAW